MFRYQIASNPAAGDVKVIFVFGGTKSYCTPILLPADIYVSEGDLSKVAKKAKVAKNDKLRV